MAKISTVWQGLWDRTALGLAEGTAEDSLAARVLHSVLIGVLAWVAFFFAIGLPFFVVRRSASAALVVLLACAALTSLFCLRRGRIRLGSWVFLAGTWFLASVLTYFSGGINSPSLAFFLAITVAATWLVGQRIALMLAGVLLAGDLALAILEATGIRLPTYIPTPPLAQWTILVFAVALTLLPLSEVLSTIRESLAQARQQVARLKEAEQALREGEERFHSIVEMAPDGIFFADSAGRFIEVNEAACRQLGHTRQELLQRTVFDIVPSRLAEAVASRMRNLRGTSGLYESCHLRSDGTEIPVELSIARMPFGGQTVTVGVARDISERKQAETEKARLEDQYRQAQKMESVGRLAGGIAHDFNNLLTVINGYGDFLTAGIAEDDPMHEYAVEIRQAGERAAGLTQQLLAFSRKQVTQPRPLNLNLVVAEAEKMLRRLLGEDIELVTTLNPALGVIMADSGQIHQVLMNLAVNARDAMPEGGKIMLETANVEIDEVEAAGHLGKKPGSYVLMAFRDTGIGMDEGTVSHIFEPFYTTKKKGEGTGLGLSTVYGIVRQSEGWISVHSEPGNGTTFKIFLPRIDACVLNVAAEAQKTTVLSGGETILVVEDQTEVRRLAARMLQSFGYQVLAAASGAEATQIAAQHQGQIHLMVTDVVMPGMTGRELAEKQHSLRPEMKVLFTSGYADNVIAHRGILEPGVFYLAKPFLPKALAEKVREILSPTSRA